MWQIFEASVRVTDRPQNLELALDARHAFVDLVRVFAVQMPVSVADEANVVPACRG